MPQTRYIRSRSRRARHHVDVLTYARSMTVGGPGRRRHLGTLACAGLVVLAPLTAACDLDEQQETPASSTPVTRTPSPTAEPGRDLLIEDRDGELVQAGTASVRIEVATLDGGRLGRAEDPDGASAIGFPPYRTSGRYPRAVVVVTSAGADDQLNPGTHPFTWGTDFRVDPRSDGRAEDNGDNLIQRGLYSESTLYKAELDLGRPACVVQGPEGTVTIRSAAAVVAGVWYHMECRRDGPEVTVVTWPLADPDDQTSRVAVGTTGDLTPADPAVPLSIGGKVSSTGEVIRSATDQMNGDLARPFLRIDR